MKVLGIKNLTEHAGSTTFIYMLKKQLKKMKLTVQQQNILVLIKMATQFVQKKL